MTSARKASPFRRCRRLFGLPRKRPHDRPRAFAGDAGTQAGRGARTRLTISPARHASSALKSPCSPRHASKHMQNSAASTSCSGADDFYTRNNTGDSSDTRLRGMAFDAVSDSRNSGRTQHVRPRTEKTNLHRLHEITSPARAAMLTMCRQRPNRQTPRIEKPLKTSMSSGASIGCGGRI